MSIDPMQQRNERVEPNPPLDREVPKKKKKRDSSNEEVEEMAQALFIYWKSRDIVRTGECDFDEANEKAELMWKEETNEHTLDAFRKAAAVQIVMLGGEYVGNKRRRQVKSEFGKNRAECNPFLLFCKDHRENVREKGSRGKGMTTLSTMWKNLTEDEKTKYVEMAKTNKSKEIKNEANEVPFEQLEMKPEQNQPPTSL
ncbi:HMG box domain-containing protein [Entamoeba marina]